MHHLSPKPPPIRVDIILVNYNSGRYLRQCLQSVVSAGKAGLVLDRVVVVDNRSTDGSTDDLPSSELPLVVIQNRENRGFGAACNQGARDSRADLLLFLNPDMLLFHDSLEKAVAFMGGDGREWIGLCGIQLVDREGQIDRGCARFPKALDFFKGMTGLYQLFPSRFPTHIMSEWDHLRTRRVDHVTGAFFLVRRHLFERLQGFDERFFVYLEDLDFSLRLHQAGYDAYYLADAKAFHQGGYTHEHSQVTWIFYSLAGRILYAFKHFGTLSALLLTVGTIGLEPFLRLAQAAGKGSRPLMKDTLIGYKKLWADLPRILKYHRQG